MNTSASAAHFSFAMAPHGTLGSKGDGFTADSLKKSGSLQAIFLIVLCWALFLGTIHLVWINPSLHLLCFPLFPPLFGLTFAATLPWMMYVTWSHELGHLHPMSPRDYCRLWKKAVQVLPAPVSRKLLQTTGAACFACITVASSPQVHVEDETPCRLCVLCRP